MAIPELQLYTWTNLGAIDGSIKTYASLKNALDTYQRWHTGVELREVMEQVALAN